MLMLRLMLIYKIIDNIHKQKDMDIIYRLKNNKIIKLYNKYYLDKE